MQIIQDRRALHQIPELDSDLPKTIQYLTAVLENLKCRVFTPVEGALCAWFDFGCETAIAFRADMDALPIEEKTDLEYASQHPGQMHACGHDGHMAILLELARRLDRKSCLEHNVLLVFQPAEETTGGAKHLCQSGIFETYRVEAIFGLHLWPGLEKGCIASRQNELMCRSCEVKVTIRGKSAHIAKSHLGVDALAAGVEFYRRAMELERQLPNNVFRLLKFGKMESGSVCNAISDHTVLEGSLRAFQEDAFAFLVQGLEQIGKQLQQTGCDVELYMSDGYPAVINPEPLYRQVKKLVPFRELEQPSMTAEDFSWYQRYVPGVFFFLGVGDTPALHSGSFHFQEDVLVRGADFFEALAEKM